MEALLAIILVGGGAYVVHAWKTRSARDQAAAMGAGVTVGIAEATFVVGPWGVSGRW